MQAAVVTFDHLALAFLGCYGNTWLRTPRFNQLAAESVVFDQCFSAGALERGLSKLADRLRQQGGAECVQQLAVERRLNDTLRRTIGDWCDSSNSGRPSLLWLNSPEVRSPWSAAEEQIAHVWPGVFDSDGLQAALVASGIDVPDVSAAPESWLAAALPQLTARGVLDREMFAATRELGQLRRLVYAAAVSALDNCVGEVLDLLMADGRPDRLVIVAATGGDLTGPHAELSAGCPSIIEPLVHVPLLIRTGTAADGTRRQALTSTADIVPTLAEGFGLEAVAHAGDGRSLWPLLREESESVRDELLYGSDSAGWCLRRRDFACICGGGALRTGEDLADASPERPRLFVKPDDAWDTLDVAGQHPEVTEAMVRQMRVARETANEDAASSNVGS